MRQNVALLTGLFALALPPLTAQTVTLNHWPLLGSPGQITTGPDGALWFTANSNIGRITTSGSITRFPVSLNVNGDPTKGIATGPDGALWFTLFSSNAIGRVTTGGVMTFFQVPSLHGGVNEGVGITTGPDGALWFTEATGAIGRITTRGVVTSYTMPTRGSDPWAITVGPDNALWFTEYFHNSIGRITTAGAITEYALPIADSFPASITKGPDNALWFAQGHAIGRITTDGTITEYALPSGHSAGQITTGPDGALWFTENFGNVIGRVTTGGVITEYPPSFRFGGGITMGPDKALWFTADAGGNDISIGQIVLPCTTAGGPAPYYTEMIPTADGIDSCPPRELTKCATVDANGNCLMRSVSDSYNNSFQLWCMKPQLPNHTFSWYGLFYLPAGGDYKFAGKCPYEGGQDMGLVYYYAPSPLSPPTCFVRSTWQVVDAGIFNDEALYTPWLLCPGCKPYSWEYDFDVLTNVTTSTHFDPSGKIIQQVAVDPPPDFNNLPPTLDVSTIPSGAPMTRVRIGDVNVDGRIDCTDLKIVQGSLGKKTGEIGFLAAADVNRDGVVSILDLAMIARLVPTGTVCQ